MVGSEARMRLSLVISWPPFASGTLKSTRMNTRLPRRSRSLIESFGIGLKFESSKRGISLGRSAQPFERWGIQAAPQVADRLRVEDVRKEEIASPTYRPARISSFAQFRLFRAS